MKSDYESWLDEIYKNPLVGDDLGGGVHKIRMAIADKGKGKSGGARILTLNVKVSEDGMNVTLLIRRCHLNCRMLLPYAGWDRLGIAVYSLQLISWLSKQIFLENSASIAAFHYIFFSS